MKTRVLVVDDEPGMVRVISTALSKAGHDCQGCGSGPEALAALEERLPDVVVTDWKMPGMSGFELLEAVKRDHSELPVILLTAFGDVRQAVSAMKAGAFDYLTKPFDNEELRRVVARALELTRLHRENRYLRQEVASRYSPEGVVAESPHAREVLELVRRVAPSRASVLVQGPSGTGKELVARLVHYWSDRVGQPFVPVNCKAFAAGVLESELFGHEQGAYTGASQARAGCFERADGGTLFLDEIGEVDLDFQAKLLRVLQEGEVLRVGGNRPRPVDVRVVAATNRVLGDEMAAGRFREDLYFRLNVIPIHLLPLCERPADVLPLARHFLRRYQVEAGRQLSLSAEAEQALAAHPWPGNVRELQNVMERAVVLARGQEVTPPDLLLNAAPSSASPGPPGPSAGTLQECLDDAARKRISAALQESGNHRADAAERLGIDRTTLYRWMKRLGLS